MKRFYKEWRPNQASLDLVFTANQIIDEYAAQRYTLTLRQLYYQFVARDIIENTERSYKNLGAIITRARMAGLVSWEAIEDRNRENHQFWMTEDILKPIRNLPNYIRFDQWARQDTYVEVWVEKEALGNVVNRACSPLLVPYMSCKGYLSASEAWRAGSRYEEKLDEGKNCVLIHLGDHDPSGIDMTRDNDDRLELFAGEKIDVRRIALNMDQVSEYNPPTNPAKITDSRAKDYIKKYGRSSWELDALEPAVLEKLIKDEIRSFIDWDKWNEVTEQEDEAEDKLHAVYDNWDEISDLLDNLND